MIDFHTHILPNIDNGSRNIEETFNLIKEAKEAGFEGIVLTSHYKEGYYETDTPEREMWVNAITENLRAKGIDIKIYFLLFIIYAIIGWCMEVICKLIQYKKFVDRGFLIGPYCPIYGVGALLITLFLNKYTQDPVVLFVMAVVVCGVLEYLTSYFMEKIYHARWWDYSSKKFNINGRICLSNLIAFGILGMFIMYISNPFLMGQLEKLTPLSLNIIFWIILVIFLADNIVSGIINNSIKITTKQLGEKMDNTEEITKKVREILQKKSALHRRLINAYPKIQAVKVKIKEKTRKIKEQIEEQKEDIKDKIDELKSDNKK